MPNAANPDQLFEHARQAYAALGVDVDQALQTLGQTPISLHCWQGDDVTGFENQTSASAGGIAVTGAYPGKATNPDELRVDLEKALQHLPGKHKLNLHACYLENGGTPVDRDAIEPKHFARWIDWCKANNLGMDFNPTCFAHHLADDGFTLSHQDPAVRDFWIAHCQASRNIGAFAAEQLGQTCVTNVWIPDGYKDTPADRMAPRQRLQASLDTIFSVQLPSNHIDAVESKLFGIGSESFVVGSHEFYMGYATSRQTALCLDMGHFHPTESVADKISSTLLYVPELLLHTSRGVRWDSDHVVTTNDETKALMQAVVGCGVLDRVHIGLDFFDASINRIAAWVIGARATRKALLQALLTPWEQLKAAENDGDLTERIALQEACNTLPFAAVWQRFLEMENCQPDLVWLQDVRIHEQQVLHQR